MPPYKKPNSGPEERRRNKWGGERRSHQVTFEATLTTRTTVSIEKRTPVHLAPSLRALEPNVGDHIEGNVEKRILYIYF